MLAVCCALIAASCHKESAPVVTEPTIFDIMVEDYQALVKAFPLAKDNFVEARFVLNNEISAASAASLKTESMEVICYTWIEGFSEIFVLDHDLTTGKTEMNHYSVDTPWTGDMKIPESEMQGLKVSLEEAIERAKKDPEAAAGDGLDTRYVTFRTPLWPGWPNPQYVIGGSAGRKNHVFVDSKTGDVVSLEAPVEEGTAKAFISEDYNMMIDQFGNFEIMGYKIEIHEHWVEAQYILNAPVNSRQASELFPKEVTYLFYAPGASKDGKDVMARGWRDFTAGPMAKLDMSMEELRIVRHSRWMNKDNALYPALFELLFKEELQVVVNKLNETSTMDLVLEYKTTKSSFKKEKISVILLERYDSMKDEERKNAFKILLRKGLITKDNK